MTTTTTREAVITAENVSKLGEIIAARALKTMYQKSGMSYIWDLYKGLITDVRERKISGEPFSDGMDVAQEASLYLTPYIGERIDTATRDGQTDKNGEKIDVWRGAFRACHKWIRKEKKRVLTEISVDEINENGERVYYKIPYEWDIDKAEDLKRLFSLVDALHLTARQAQVFRYRMRGIAVDDKSASNHGKKRDSVRTIAAAMGITARAVQKHIDGMRESARELAKTDTELAAAMRRMGIK